MALGSSWWSGLGEASRWLQDWSGYSWGWFNYTGSLLLCLSRANLFQMPYSNGTAGGLQQNEAGYDTGYFYFNQTPAIVPLIATGVGLGGVGADTATARPQWVELGNGPVILTGDGLSPSDSSTPYRRAYYKTGFVYDAGATRLLFQTGAPTTEADVHILMPFPTTVGRWYLYHYNPWAWSGTVPEVVAAILMKCGHDPDYIDTDSFDNAHDAFDLSTGDMPYSSTSGTMGSHYWFGCGTKSEIYCSRKVGQSCIDLIKECIRHSRDFYFVNESGQFSVNSYTRPNQTVATLSLNDGIVGKITRDHTIKYTFNDCLHSWGSAVRAYGNVEAQASSSSYSASEETGIESYNGTNLSASKQNLASIARFGTLYMNGPERLINKRGQPIMAKAPHYPFILNPGTLLAGYGVPFISAFIDRDALSRRELKFKQDFRGLDWSVGDEVQNVAITGDGETIPVTRCIEREYDFDNLTITSILLEEPEW